MLSFKLACLHAWVWVFRRWRWREPPGHRTRVSTVGNPGPAQTQPTPSTGEVQTSTGTETNTDDVVVTGIRASLRASIDLKRDAQGVVDAISAEDIGKFPDTNLAESLQRITGVSIDAPTARASSSPSAASARSTTSSC